MWVFRSLCTGSLLSGEGENQQSYPEAWSWCQVGRPCERHLGLVAGVNWVLSPFLPFLADSSAPCSSLQLAVPCSLSAP